MTSPVFKELNKGLSAFAICFALQIICRITVRNPLTVIFFLLALYLERKYDCSKKNRTVYAIMLIPAAIIVWVLRNYLQGDFSSAVFRIMSVGIVFVGIWRLLCLAVSIATGVGCAGNAKGTSSQGLKCEGVLKGAEAGQMPEKNTSENSRKTFLVSGAAIVLITTGICLLCWLPYYLYEYPGIMTADSLVQYEQIIGIRPYSNHHPMIHTLCIAFFYRIGFAISGDPGFGIACYTAAQMIFMALCCGIVTCTVNDLWNENKKERGLFKKQKLYAVSLITCIFFALVPFNAVFSVTIWKDVPAAGITMLLLCRLCSMIGYNNFENRRRSFSFYELFSFIILCILFSLFRSNAYFALWIGAPFIIYTFRSRIKQIVPALVAAIVIAGVIRGPVMSAAGIEQADFTESLSVPLQQVARVLVEDRQVDDKDIALIDTVIDRTYIHELYAADFADNIKELVRAGHPEELEKKRLEFLGLWLRLLIKYPGDYINAWFDLDGGYIYPDVSYEVGNIDGIMVNDLGLVSTPKLGGKAFIKLKEIMIKMGSFVPLYGMLWCIGAYTVFDIFALAVVIGNKEYKKYMVIMLIPLSLILTLCIAAPMVDFRYAYAVVMTMPLSAAICGIILNKKAE